MKLFNGETFDPDQDTDRLWTQLVKVRNVMFDGNWHQLKELVRICGGTEASISARIRDLRKKRFGKYIVDRRRVRAGLWEYRLELPNNGKTND
jgi:hypothetical protein